MGWNKVCRETAHEGCGFFFQPVGAPELPTGWSKSNGTQCELTTVNKLTSHRGRLCQ